jgi:hypothetical protein
MKKANAKGTGGLIMFGTMEPRRIWKKRIWRTLASVRAVMES